MKIGLVLSSVPGYSETFFRNKIKGLQDRGFEVLLFVDYLNPSDVDLPCQVIACLDFNNRSLKTVLNSILAFLKAAIFSPKQSFRLYQLDKNDGVPFNRRLKNIVLNQFFFNQSFDWLHFGFGMLAKNRENVAKAIGAKMAVSFRGFDLYLSPLKHPDCYNLLFKKDVRYHVLSHGMKETLKEYVIQENNIQIITPAIDTDFFQNNSKLQQMETAKTHIVTVARLHWKKGLEYTLEALAILKQKGFSFQYTIIGEGDQRERLIFAAHQLGILDDVQFVGKLTPEEVKQQLSQSTIYLQYSIQEGFCNAVLEAQAMGLLCIVSNAEGLDENVLDNQTGWVVPKRQPALLTKKIIETIQLPIEQQELIRQRAIQRVRDNFNLSKQNEAFQLFYKEKTSYKVS